MGGYYGSPKVILKNNKDLLGKRNKLTRKDYIGFKDIYTEDHIKATPELLEQIRNNIAKENKKRERRQILFVFLSILFTILIIYGVSNLEWIGIRLKSIN